MKIDHFPLHMHELSFYILKKYAFWLHACIFFFTAIRQEIKDIEEGRYDSKMNPLKVSIEQI